MINSLKILNHLPYLIIDDNFNILKISKEFKEYSFKPEIKKSLFLYIKNNIKYKDFLLNNNENFFTAEIYFNNNTYFFKTQKILNNNKIILIFFNITNEINHSLILKKDINNVLKQLKKKNLYLKNYYNLLDNNGFIFCIFKPNGDIITKNTHFDLFLKKEINSIEELFKEAFPDLIYKLKLNKIIKNYIIKHENNYYELFISNINDVFYLIGYDINKQIEDKEELFKNNETIINIIGYAVHEKSEFTNLHIHKVRKYTETLATLYKNKYNAILQEDIELLGMASILHDIGKLEIPNSILEKKGKLTPEEFEVMKTHPEKGKKLIEKYSSNLNEQSKLMKMCSIVAYEHHEKWNGKGYPKGKKKNEIHLYGRIVALADVLEALISKRPYKRKWTKEEVIVFLKKERKKSFDPLLVDLVLENFYLFY